MNTHILISVDAINKEIHNLQKRIGITEYGKIKLEVLQNILKENKQISLDEYSIEKKAAEFAIANTGFYSNRGIGLHEAYKQAFRDIIK